MYKYQQLSETLRSQIEEGKYQKGDRLPSIRELTEQYQCNKETVLKALQQLKEEHLLYPVDKSGYYVMKDLSENTVRTHAVLPNPGQFSIEDFRRCLNESLIALQDVDAAEDTPRGDRALLESLHPLFEQYGVYAPLSRMVVTTGTQQALYVLLQLIGQSGLLLEQPTYRRMNQLVTALGIPYRTIDRTLEGDTIDLEALEAAFASGEVRYFYTISRFHQPLGVSYSDAVKKRIVELAARYDIYIIEDDYMADYEVGSATPLHYYDTHYRVIYVKSFSSILFASFKIGAVVLPESLVSDFVAMKQLLDYDSNHLMQKTLALYISNGMFAKHRQKMVARYQARSKLLAPIASNHPVHGMQVLLLETVFDQLKDDLPEESRIEEITACYMNGTSPYRLVDFSQVKSNRVVEWLAQVEEERE